VTVEEINARKIPFAEVLGIVFVSAEPDKLVAQMKVRADLCTANSRVHGGALMAFADTVGAFSTFANLPEGAQGTTTLESKTNFISSAPAGTTLTATSTPLHRGKRTHVWTTRIVSDDGKLVAVVTQTQMIL
jgi:1,4-dihydroxy-2-naphthoyl-CoA hydrolase